MSDSKMKQVTLVSSDNQEYVVDIDVAESVVGGIFEEIDETKIPILSVNGVVLGKVVEYCKYHAAAKKEEGNQNEEEVKAWDTEFIKVDTNLLFEIMLAANYLGIVPLLDLCCLKVGNMIKGKTPEEIYAKFKIEDDFTPEEEMEVRKELSSNWAFD